MKLKLIVLLFSMLFGTATFAGMAELDWATVKTPDSVNERTGYEFVVTLKKAFPAGTHEFLLEMVKGLAWEDLSNLSRHLLLVNQ